LHGSYLHQQGWAAPNRIELRTSQAGNVRNIRIGSITVGKRMRPLGDIHALVGSIREVGCCSRSRSLCDRRLVSRLHPLAAFKALGRRTIPAS
jgi:hypothetical protein